MSSAEKLLAKAQNAPQNITFKQLCTLAEKAGFQIRKNTGGHLIYKHKTIQSPDGMMTFQPDKRDKSKAKPYQVKQLTDFIDQHNIQI